MEGRWTIRKTRGGTGFSTIDGPETGLGPGVPVVPCDDAAIERVARAIRAQNLHLSLPTCFERARDYLAAAGETP